MAGKSDIADLFLNQYKSLELFLRLCFGNDMTILRYEEQLEAGEADKLRLCRNVRNFMQHNPDAAGFVAPTASMLAFLEKLTAGLAVQQEKAADCVYVAPVVKLSGTMRDAAKVLTKSGADWAPVLDKKGCPVAILTRDRLLELMAGTAHWEDTLETLYKPAVMKQSMVSVSVAADLSEVGSLMGRGRDIIVMRSGKYSGIVRCVG